MPAVVNSPLNSPLLMPLSPRDPRGTQVRPSLPGGPPTRSLGNVSYTRPSSYQSLSHVGRLSGFYSSAAAFPTAPSAMMNPVRPIPTNVTMSMGVPVPGSQQALDSPSHWWVNYGPEEPLPREIPSHFAAVCEKEDGQPLSDGLCKMLGFPMGTKWGHHKDDDAPAKEGALLMSDNNRFQPDYPDTTVTLVPYFSVPKGKMSEFKSHFGKFYQHTINGTFSNGPCLFYGFAISDDTVFCREGYASAEGVLAHLDEVKEELDAACGLVGPTGLSLSVMGPKAELDALRPALSPLGCSFRARRRAKDTFKDTHVTLCPYFTVPAGKMEEFKANYVSFYEHTFAGTKAKGQCLYYGFSEEGNTVFCREGYASAEGVLAHLDEVKEELAIACQIVGAGGLDLAVMGPGPELDKLRSSLEPLGAKFFTLDEGAISKV